MKDHALLGWVRIEGADGNSVGATNPLPVQLSGSSTADAGVEIVSKSLAFSPAVAALQVKNVGGSDLTVAVTDNGKTYTVPDGDAFEIRIAEGITEAAVTAPGKWYWVALV